MYDVAIIGGGIAGLTAATLLSKKGFNVVVLEKSTNLGAHNKLQMQGFPAFEIPTLPIRVPLKYKVKKALLWTPSQSVIPFHFEKPILYLHYRGAEHSVDTFLHKLALKAGASIITASEVRKLGFGKTINEITTSGGAKYKARCILAADGASSRTRRILRVDVLEPKGIGYGAVMENIDIEPMEIHGAFSQKIAPMGYSYIIGHSDETATVAVSARPNYLELKLGEYFKRTLKFFRPIIKNGKKINIFSGIVTCGNGTQTLVHKNILFIGEAGGFQDPTLGFGMAPSMRSAEIAVKLIADALATADDRTIYLKKLEQYDKLAKMNLTKKEIKWKWIMRKEILEKISDYQLDSLLQMLHGKDKLIEKALTLGLKQLWPFLITTFFLRPFLFGHLIKSMKSLVHFKKNTLINTEMTNF
ncbi:NAD(P)/FAD-dependent oxidoreductase [Candidatus Borrarchaeum sp.]|uniref:NAD(P)/FAD-dependent oxidoreductase n=1 Tax=Candidatus Borrarchaeum sp. TaxID=2846742 RepID=UPI00257C0914|nr:NAD(P)/FAD-dependent oxidoreductase [Candidatus Borrarchaeum sp.]